MELDIIHNEDDSQFEAIIEDLTAFVQYHQIGEDQIAILSTQVPKELEGRGIAAAITKFALDYAQEKGLKVQPICSYTVAYITRHPEYQSLVK